MFPHRIRLRGPWEATPLTATRLDAEGRVHEVDAPLPPAGPMVMPCRWRQAGWGDFSGRARFARRFQWVKPLQAQERLWLGCLGADTFARFVLNDELLGEQDDPFGPVAFDITHRVQSRNGLVVEVDCPADPGAAFLWRDRLGPGGGLWGTVFLEVRREVSFTELTVEPLWSETRPALRVLGALAGAAQAQGVNLSLRVGREEIHFGPVGSSGNIDLTAPLPTSLQRWQPRGRGEPFLHELQVDLMDAHMVLDHHEIPFGLAQIEAGAHEGLVVNGEPHLWPTSYHVTGPLAEAALLDEAARSGRLLAGVLPVRPLDQLAASRREAASRIVERIKRSTARYPCLVGWEFAP